VVELVPRSFGDAGEVLKFSSCYVML